MHLESLTHQQSAIQYVCTGQRGTPTASICVWTITLDSAALGPHLRDARPEPEVGRRAVRNAQAVLGEHLPLCPIQHAAVREPAVILVPAHPPADSARTGMILVQLQFFDRDDGCVMCLSSA